MEDQIPASVPPSEVNQPPIPLGQPPINDLEAMKQRARELAIAQYMAQKQAQEPIVGPEFRVEQPFIPAPKPQIIYVRRNLTVAELLLTLLLACGIVTGIQFTWNFAANLLPKIEVNIRK